MFLIRDWLFTDEQPYGLKGGNKLLNEILIANDRQPLQLQRVKEDIGSCFENLTCFLMPHPGVNVGKNSFDGRLSSINIDFLEQLETLVPLLVSPSKLVVKKIAGFEVTGTQLLEYFKVYVKVIQGETMPEPKSMLEGTAEANNRAALALALDNYQRNMKALVGVNTPYVDSKELEKKHMELLSLSVELFHKPKKFRGKEYSERYLKELNNSIEEARTKWK